MSNEKIILDYIESKISSIPDGPKPSRHFYDLSKNDDVKNNFIYALRPGGTSLVTGTIQNATYDQSFELEISADYVEKNSGDVAVREAIEKIDSFCDLLQPKFIHRVNPILLVKPFTKAEPVVDQNKKSVSRIYTFEITYRISLKGAP